jgi:UDP-glucose 4-epimerase
MDILLAGASGFIGGYVRKALSQKHHVFALAREGSPGHEQGVDWIRVDLAQAAQNLPLPRKVDAVVYLAQSRHYREFPEKAWPIFNVNVQALMVILEYARQCGAKRFLFASSANVYKRSERRITEQSALQPTSFYARSKLIAEMLIESYAEYFHCNVFRFFTVYGPGQKGMLIPSLVERVRDNKPIEIRGRRGLKLTPVYVTDVSSAIQAALEREVVSTGFEVFNVGGDEALSVYELGCGIGKALKMRPEFNFMKGEREAGWMADSAKLKRAFRLQQFVPFEHGITRVLYE